MFKALLSTIQKRAQNDTLESRRRYPRREKDACICTINGRAFPVENWSLGGVLIHGDHRLFTVGKEVEIVLKFRLDEGVLDIQHRAVPVRKTRSKIAFQFTPMTRQTTKKFQTVMRSYTK